MKINEKFGMIGFYKMLDMNQKDIWIGIGIRIWIGLGKGI
jgi:hypothetical protein